MDHRNRAKLIDVPERRDLQTPLEFREDAASGDIILEGYASTWDPYDCYGGPDAGGWVEQIDRAAVRRTLAEKPDLMLLINHEGLPIARTTSGNLDLMTDDHGLFVRARLDPSDPDVQRLAPKMKARGKGNRPLMDEMSFAFRVKDQVWDTNYTHRNITELSLQKGDVSVVNYGMNPNTRTGLAAAVGTLAQLSNKELAEVRKLDPGTVEGAMATLQRAWRADDEKKPPNDPDAEDDPDKKKAKAHNNEKGDDLKGRSLVDFTGNHLLFDGQCVTCGNSRSIGDVEYADPGYLDSERQAASGNGVQRLPVDEVHARVSWNHILVPKNQRGYTLDQLASIKGVIRAARKMFGQEDDDKPKDDDKDKDQKTQAETPVEISHIEQVRKFGGGVSLVAVMTDGTRTPLPSFRQSGELYTTPSVIPSLDASKIVSGTFRGDPPPWVKDDEDDEDEDEDMPSGRVYRPRPDERMTETEDGKKVTHPDDDEDRGKLPPQFIDKIKGDKAKGDKDDDDKDDDEKPKRSISDQLRELRKETGSFPASGTVKEASAYLKSLA